MNKTHQTGSRVLPRRVRSYKTLSLRTVAADLNQALEVTIDEALHDARPTLFAQEHAEEKARIVVALSGGRDSVALLHALAELKTHRNSPIESLWAVHVHHALSPNAGRWARFCRELCQNLGIDYKVYHVMVKTKGEGIEAAARKARYDALMKAAKGFGANMVMTAHHQDDRLETFLIQWMRGAGVDGLATFPAVREEGGIRLVRPWLEMPREAIERFLELKALTWVDDESNDDVTLLRNALRHEVLPKMDEARSGFRRAAARSVALVAEASNLLAEYAREDLERVTVAPDRISIPRLMALSEGRQALALRAWIESFDLEAPSKAKLDEALRQARLTHSDTKLTFNFGTHAIRRHGADLVMRRVATQKKDTSRHESLVWKGEGEYPVTSWSGVLLVKKAQGDEPGVPLYRLENAQWQVRPRQGGETMKIHKKRPRKHLKYWYQEAGIAEFDRQDLPLLWCDDQLVFAAGIGTEVRLQESDAQEFEERFTFEWVPDATLLSLMQD